MLNKLSKIRNKINSNKDSKVLVQNFTYLSLLQVAGYIFPLITMPYLARVIGVDGFGKIAFATAAMIWLQAIADWGFNFTATRDVAQNRDNPEKISEIFSNVLWARCVLMFFSGIILFILVIFVPLFKENKDVLLISFLMIPGHIMFPDWFFQAMERMKYITILNVISKLLFTIAIFLFIKEKKDYILQPLLNSLGFLFSGIVAFYLILIKWKIKLRKPSLNCIILTIHKGTDVFLNNLMPTLYNSFSTILLGILGGEIANGIFDAGKKFILIVQQFMAMLSRTFFPFLSRNIKKHYIYAKINIILSIVFSSLLFFFAPIIINTFFTRDFLDSVIVLRIMSVSIFFLSLSNVYGTNFLIINRMEHKLRNITIVVSALGFILSFPLIYIGGYIGAAITVTSTRGLLGITTMLVAKQQKQNVLTQDK